MSDPFEQIQYGNFRCCGMGVKAWQQIIAFIARVCRLMWPLLMAENVANRSRDQVAGHYGEPQKLRDWMKAFQENDDQDAFQRIFEYYREKLWRKLHLYRFYGFEPEDMFQDVNRDIARFLKNDIPHNLIGLVYRIADRKMVDFLRKESRLKKASIEVPLEEVEGSLAKQRLDQEAWGSGYDLQRFLFSKWVNAKQREILVLHFLLGHSLSEIQVQTGIPLNTVKSRLREGLRKLRAYSCKTEYV